MLALGLPRRAFHHSKGTRVNSLSGVWTFKQKVQPADLQTGDAFGYSVAVSRNLIAVGAPAIVTSGAGAVYIFRTGATSVVQEAKITLSGSMQFGYSVDLWDDRLIVGEITNNAAHVYRRASPGDWGASPEDTLLPPSTDLNKEFGESVAIYQGLALVGDSELQLPDVTRPGAVYPFFLNGTTWTAGPRINHPETQSAAHFGFGIDLYGLYAVIGAYNQSIPDPADGQGTIDFVGKAYVFRLEQGAWTQGPVQTLTAAGPQMGDLLGNAVSLDAGRMVVGAPGSGPGGGSASNGAVHLYELQQNGIWLAAGVIIPTELEPEDSFGWSVCVSTFVVGGAPNDQINESVPFTKEGSIYAAPFE